MHLDLCSHLTLVKRIHHHSMEEVTTNRHHSMHSRVLLALEEVVVVVEVVEAEAEEVDVKAEVEVVEVHREGQCLCNKGGPHHPSSMGMVSLNILLLLVVIIHHLKGNTLGNTVVMMHLLLKMVAIHRHLSKEDSSHRPNKEDMEQVVTILMPLYKGILDLEDNNTTEEKSGYL